METPAAFASEEDLRRVMRAVRHLERQFNAPQLTDTPEPPGGDPGPVTTFAKVTELAARSDGFYPARVYALGQVTSIDPPVKPWVRIDDTPALLFTIDGTPLAVDDFVPCTVVGAYRNKMIAVALTGVGGASSLATRNMDGTEVGTTTDMRFEQATGIEIRQSPGAVDWDQVRLREATPTQWGVFNTDVQTVGGRKTSTTGIYGSRGGWYANGTVTTNDDLFGYVPFQVDYTNAATPGTDRAQIGVAWPWPLNQFQFQDQYTNLDPVTTAASPVQTAVSITVRHGEKDALLPETTTLMLVKAPNKSPFGHEHVVACGNPISFSSHTWGTFVGTTLKRGITSVTTSPTIVPHEWCGGLVITQKEMAALVPSSPPPPASPPAREIVPPKMVDSPPTVPTSPPLPNGGTTPGLAFSAENAKTNILTAQRVILVAPNGTSVMLTANNAGTLDVTAI